MSASVTPQQLQDIVEEVLQRVKATLAGVPAPAARPDSSTPSACTLAHGVAARPPATRETPAAAASSGMTGVGVSTGGGEAVAHSRGLLDAGACRVGHCAAAPVDAGHSASGPAHVAACNELAPLLDHTLLKPNATDDDIRKLCEEARRHQFATVCVNSAHVGIAAALLAGSGVRVCSVVGFPLGAMTTESKAFETRQAIGQGAGEIDMVIHVGKLQQGDYGYVLRDIEAVVAAAHGIPLKVIIEASLLDDEQKIIACALAKAAGAQFVKTSTGFASGGATPADVALMRRIVGEDVGVKAAGGIRDCETAMQMVAAGANRLGASASVAILKGQKSKGTY